MRTQFTLIWLALTLAMRGLGASQTDVTAAVAPIYPPLAVSSRISGTVTVRSTLSESGEVSRTEVVQGHPLLSHAAEEAAKQWKFERSSISGRTYDLKFTFVLLSEDAPESSRTIFLPPNQIEVDQRPAKPPVNYSQ